MNISQYHRERIACYIAAKRTFSPIEMSSKAMMDAILDMVEEAQPQSKSNIEMRDNGKGKLAFVLTSEDGTVRHWLAPSRGFEGQPRPTIPGTYWNPEKPTEVYTLARTGWWSHNVDGRTLLMDVPDDLQLLGAFE